MERLVGLVLAGGAGRRMGAPKGGVEWRGRTLARRAAELLAPLCETVLISVAPGADNPAPGFARIEDAPPGGQGPLAGIAAGFRLSARDLLVVACDYPAVDADLLDAVQRAAAPEDDVAYPVDPEGRDHPLVGVWRHSAAPAVEAALGEGRLEVRGLLSELRVRRLVAADLPGIDLARRLANVNAPADLGRLAEP